MITAVCEVQGPAIQRLDPRVIAPWRDAGNGDKLWLLDIDGADKEKCLEIEPRPGVLWWHADESLLVDEEVFRSMVRNGEVRNGEVYTKRAPENKFQYMDTDGGDSTITYQPMAAMPSQVGNLTGADMKTCIRHLAGSLLRALGNSKASDAEAIVVYAFGTYTQLSVSIFDKDWDRQMIISIGASTNTGVPYELRLHGKYSTSVFGRYNPEGGNYNDFLIDLYMAGLVLVHEVNRKRRNGNESYTSASISPHVTEYAGSLGRHHSWYQLYDNVAQMVCHCKIKIYNKDLYKVMVSGKISTAKLVVDTGRPE